VFQTNGQDVFQKIVFENIYVTPKTINFILDHTGW